jgi:hypothetical protein
MVGFFKMWSVSGLTTDGAKLSEPLNELGRCISDRDYFDSLNTSDKTTLIAIGKHMLAMKDVFDTYFRTKNKSYHDDAVKYLVMVAAVIQGADGMGWSWQNVRHFSQGLYGSMMDDARSFEHQNIPIIETLSTEIENLIESAIK